VIVLAIETATLEVGVALCSDEGLLGEERAHPGRGHAEHLHPAIERVLTTAGVDFRQLDAIAVDIGPGLFTGLRVGIAAAQGLALALGIGVVACTSTAILAPCRRGSRHRAGRRSAAGRRCVAAAGIDRCDRLRPTGHTRRVARGARGEPVRLVGDGAVRYAELFGQSTLVSLKGAGQPSAPPVSLLAERGLALARGGQTSAAAHLEARYLKPPDAKINFATRPTVAATVRVGE